MKIQVQVFCDQGVNEYCWKAEWPVVPRIGEEVTFIREGDDDYSQFIVTSVTWFFQSEHPDEDDDDNEDWVHVCGDAVNLAGKNCPRDGGHGV